MDSILAQELAQQLWQARLLGQPCAPLSETNPGISIADAYQISRLNFERRIQLPGVRVVGKKIGLTSRAVQKQLGVDQPDFGYLTSDMLVRDGAVLPAQSLIQGRVEGEVAFTLKRALKGPGLGPADVRAATDSVQACIEIIDSRVRDWKIKIQDTIADNASSAFFVLAPERFSLDHVDLVAAKMQLLLNQELRSTGVGSACLDDPVLAVTWLANALGAFGVCLEAGDIILSGAYGPVVPVKSGDHCIVEIASLGRAEFTVG